MKISDHGEQRFTPGVEMKLGVRNLLIRLLNLSQVNKVNRVGITGKFRLGKWLVDPELVRISHADQHVGPEARGPAVHLPLVSDDAAEDRAQHEAQYQFRGAKHGLPAPPARTCAFRPGGGIPPRGPAPRCR